MDSDSWGEQRTRGKAAVLPAGGGKVSMLMVAASPRGKGRWKLQRRPGVNGSPGNPSPEETHLDVSSLGFGWAVSVSKGRRVTVGMPLKTPPSGAQQLGLGSEGLGELGSTRWLLLPCPEGP